MKLLKLKKNWKIIQLLRGPALPLTALYIDQIASQVGTINEYEDIRTQASHAVSGTVSIGVMEVGYGNDNA